ncbi:MAG: hypothetical protein HP494_14535 [Nitrospira sp.]|nr:hypothetical protein [Nitrospira sp.]
MNAAVEHTEAKILLAVHEQGSILLEKLLSFLPGLTWNQIFTSVDALSRQGAVCLRRRGFDYELWMPSPSATGLVERTIIPSTERCDTFPYAA